MSIIAIGELLAEFFPEPFKCPLTRATQFERHAGGAPLTFAATVQSLGGKALLLAVVGSDVFSQFIVETMGAESLSVEGLRRVEDRPLGLVFHDNSAEETQLTFYRREAAGRLLGPTDISDERLAGAEMVYFPGVTLQISESAAKACFKATRWAQRHDIPVVVDPNLRALQGNLEGRHALARAVKEATIVTPNQAEATALTGASDPRLAGRRLLAMGPRMVAVTMAAAGSWLFYQDQEIFVPGFPVDVVEPTGAGDAFSAALCLGYLRKWPPERIALFANAAGALAVKAIGHLGEALPTPPKIAALMQQVDQGG